jgi:Glycosyl transferase family 2
MMRDEGPLVCLLIVRDAADELPAWLEGIALVADAVVAMDLGSSDETYDTLASHPLVHTVLTATGPRGRGLAQNRLLRAAAPLRPRWILTLDVDEQILAEHAGALRSFLATDALPELAYGLRLVRTTPDRSGYDLLGPVAYRLFAYDDDLRFAADASPLAMVPTVIPPSRWVATALRITTTVGPPDAAPEGWDEVEGTPGALRRLESRPETGQAVLRSEQEVALQVADGASDGPVISVVVEGDDATAVGWTVRSAHEQRCLDPYEVVAVVSSGSEVPDADAIGPTKLVTVAPGTTRTERRRDGLSEAAGEFVLFLPGGATLLPGCLDAHVREHDRGHALVAGDALNGTGTRVGWASYFLERSSLLPARAATTVAAAPAGCSFSRDLLGADVRAPRPGLRAVYAPGARRIEPGPRSPGELLRDRFAWGRLTARLSAPELWRATTAKRAGAQLQWAMTFGPRELSRVDTNVARWGSEHAPLYRRARPWVAAGAFAAWAGACVELAAGTARRRRR